MDIDDHATFARNHALTVFKSKAVYSFIPKNACSTLRFSLAVSNGYLEPDSDPNWIHLNINMGSGLFRASDADIESNSYSFVVLRCPFRRLASAYIDKAVNGQYPALHLAHQIHPQLYNVEPLDREIAQLTFSDFVDWVTSVKPDHLDEHFRPQSDFLVRENYSRWFSVEKFGDAVKYLADDIGFVVRDTRQALGHGTSKLERIEADFSSSTVADFRLLRAEGKSPNPRSLYTDGDIAKVLAYYESDFSLYREHCDDRDFLFPLSIPGGR